MNLQDLFAEIDQLPSTPVPLKESRKLFEKIGKCNEEQYEELFIRIVTTGHRLNQGYPFKEDGGKFVLHTENCSTEMIHMMKSSLNKWFN